MTSHITTHVLDAVTGVPAAGVEVSLSRVEGDSITVLATGVTNQDGRNRELGPQRLQPGVYRMRFATGEYFAARNLPTFYPAVNIDFTVEEGQDHYHVPCLLSPFAYSTYRGS
ncbi:hydroxyisourate hydrolase [Georgenia satyanarayanai]|uniref:hydroxyisourate hydrolase n=1 Tax=Georgenia satyanarayanai TaxID=860221 RepID=UPI00203B916E|nr:hydroxyisourate hydrolase [Georgenia satyanarayanai]MCM3660610.1 hydroxyisourate hydrolase [Georgenia satyanarayanai]